MWQVLAFVPSVAALLALIVVTAVAYRRSGEGALLQIPIAIYVWPFLFALAYIPVTILLGSSRMAVPLGTVLFSVAGGVLVVRAAIGVERAMR